MTQVVRVSDAAALANAAATRIAEAAAEAIALRGRFVFSLAGGSTPGAAYQALAGLPGVDWAHVLLIFGDERCVPPDHSDSNYRMVAETLLAPLQTKPRILRMAGENPDPSQAASGYEAELRSSLGDDGAADLALLGIGNDGHTASLFPGREALKEQQAWCVNTLAPDNTTARLTLTAPFLRRSRALLFLASGEAKGRILPAVLEDRPDPERFPAQLFLHDTSLNVTLLTDEAAAAGLG